MALVGSYARGTAESSSDIDLVILCSRPDFYLEHDQWINQFGEVQKQQVEDYGKVTSIRIWYENGLEVEYGLTGADWAALPIDEGTLQVMQEGMKILFERSSLLSLYIAKESEGN